MCPRGTSRRCSTRSGKHEVGGRPGQGVLIAEQETPDGKTLKIPLEAVIRLGEAESVDASAALIDRLLEGLEKR